MVVDERQTLEQLEGQDWGDPEAAPTGMVARCLRLRRVTLRDICEDDLRLLVSQKIGLSLLVPKALQHVSADPLVETEFYSGDLLRALLRVGKEYWSNNPAQLQQLVSIVRAVVNHGGDVASECHAFLAENLNVPNA